MAKKSKKVVAEVIADVAGVVTAPVAAPVAEVVVAAPAAVLTKRARLPLGEVLIATKKTARNRTPHTLWTWTVFQATLPATAGELVKALETAKVENEAIRTKCGNLNSHVSYYVRRGLLTVQPK